MSRAFTFAAFLAVAALASSVATPASAQLLQRKDLSYKVAVELAQEALAECHRHNWPSSVVVVDRGGDTLVMLRDDNAGPHTMENARRKAYTARTFKMTSEEFVAAHGEGAGAPRSRRRCRASSAFRAACRSRSATT